MRKNKTISSIFRYVFKFSGRTIKNDSNVKETDDRFFHPTVYSRIPLFQPLEI